MSRVSRVELYFYRSPLVVGSNCHWQKRSHQSLCYNYQPRNIHSVVAKVKDFEGSVSFQDLSNVGDTSLS